MKQFKNLLFLSLILLCWTLVSCKSSKTSSGWSLIWEENFNQKKSFDSQVWSKIPRGKSDWNNYMTDFDSCYAMRKGKLVLRGIVNHTQRNDTAPYLTGGVYTKGKKAFTNGRIEICAKLNAAGGAWPAIWMLPEGAAWPSGGEIDIMERLNNDSIAYHVNDVHTFTYPRIQTKEEGQFPFNQPFYLLIDMQLGGSWVGAVSPGDLPVEMEVDWVRFYQRKSIK